jgi:hypothetical protein
MSFVLMGGGRENTHMANLTETTTESAIVIRAAAPADDAALVRLAALDSARPLGSAALVAEADGTIVAALDLATGRTIADPFTPSADLVALLEVRATRLRGRPQRTPRGPGLFERTRHALAARS